MTTAKEFNDLLWQEVARRSNDDEPEDAYAEQHLLMEDLAWSKVVLDGKETKNIVHKGGPESDRDYWFIVVEYDGTLFMGESHFDSYEFSEMPRFYEAEEYVEPVTKYRHKR